MQVTVEKKKIIEQLKARLEKIDSINLNEAKEGWKNRIGYYIDDLQKAKLRIKELRDMTNDQILKEFGSHKTEENIKYYIDLLEQNPNGSINLGTDKSTYLEIALGIK